jgi:glutamate-ammonia-ligase adenylyltransferase
MVDDLQTHSLPTEADELERCAIRMEYGADDRRKAVESFRADHQWHTEMVHRTFQSLFIEPKTSPIFNTTIKTIGVQS